jgi:hypothetical protein
MIFCMHSLQDPLQSCLFTLPLQSNELGGIVFCMYRLIWFLDFVVQQIYIMNPYHMVKIYGLQQVHELTLPTPKYKPALITNS